MKKVLYLIIIFLSLFLCISCGTKTNNEIYNKSYNVNVDIETIGDAFVPAVEIATESTLGVATYTRRSFISSYEIEAVGSCVVYEAIAVLKSGEKVDYSETLDSDNVNYYEYKAITNAHVLDVSVSAQTKYTVYLGASEREVEANLLGKDSIIDLAVLSFTDTTLIIPIKIADSDKVSKGQIVLAVGNPNGYEYYSSATMGIVSYPKRYVVENGYDLEYIQHDAAINPGNSGGSLVNINGELIGINTAKIVDEEIDSIGFAIPSNTVLKIINRLENNSSSLSKQTSGITGKTISAIKNDLIFNDKTYSDDIYELENGVYVQNITFSSPLFKIIRTNDVIISVNNETLNSLAALNYSLMISERGDEYIFVVYRNNEYITLEITI